jgi:hypothetical protein
MDTKVTGTEKSKCPITLEVIKDPVMTVFGSLYERKAIEKWLETSSYDPLTALKLSSTFLIPIEKNLTAEQLEQKAQNVRLSTSLWSQTFKMWFQDPSHNSNQYLKLKNIEKNLSNIVGWQNYCLERQNEFSLGLENYKSPYPDDSESCEEKRPKGTGKDFQFLCLGDPTDLNYIRGKDFKCSKFDFSKLYNVMFYKCNFSRSTFVGTHFDDVFFVKCTFKGESVNFYKATVENDLKFIKCRIEDGDNWEKFITDPNEFKENLELRGLKYVPSIKIQ